MRMLYVSLSALVALALVGCGGGGGSSVTPTTNFTAELTVPAGTTSSASGTPTVVEKAASELPSVEGDAFVAAAAVSPAPTTFNQAVTLTFDLETAVPAGDSVALFSMAANGDITQVSGATVILSSDRKTATAAVTSFPENGILMILII